MRGVSVLKLCHKLAVVFLLLLSPVAAFPLQLKQQTLDEWNEYLRDNRLQMDRRIDGQMPFLWIDSVPDGGRRVRSGEIVVAPFGEHVPRHVPNGLIHHWIGTAFLPEAKINSVLEVVHDYPHYKNYYQPGVIDSGIDAEQPAPAAGEERFFVRLRNQSVVNNTALDASYSASYRQVDPHRCYVIAYTTKVQQIDHYNDSTQHKLPPDQGAGYIWRLYSTTRFVERDGGVYIEVEAIALSRDIPLAARWFVDPIVRRISRDALNTSLAQTGKAVQTVVAAGSKLENKTAAGSTPAAASTYLSVR